MASQVFAHFPHRYARDFTKMTDEANGYHNANVTDTRMQQVATVARLHQSFLIDSGPGGYNPSQSL
jgi:hypothetical protein